MKFADRLGISLSLAIVMLYAYRAIQRTIDLEYELDILRLTMKLNHNRAADSVNANFRTIFTKHDRLVHVLVDKNVLESVNDGAPEGYTGD